MAIPLILLANRTNEGTEGLSNGERNLSPECIEKLAERTKRSGKGKGLKTLLAEAEAKKECDDGSHRRKPGDSTSDDDTPRRTHSGPPKRIETMRNITASKLPICT